jgi:uncharacterized membrane protein YecN with MAPEG domain
MNDDPRRNAAIERLKAKRDFRANVFSFIVINALLILIWAVTGAGYFWPIWVIGGWGIGLIFHAWTVFGQKPITESDVQREMQRNRDVDPPVG